MKKRFKDFLLDSKFFYAVLGFVLGAIVPTWFLIDKNPDALGDFGEWAGAIATFSAVVVSLYLANRKIEDVKIVGGFLGGVQTLKIINIGNVPFVFMATAESKKSAIPKELQSMIVYIDDVPLMAWKSIVVGESIEISMSKEYFNKIVNDYNANVEADKKVSTNLLDYDYRIKIINSKGKIIH